MHSKYVISIGERYGDMTVKDHVQIITPAGISEWRWKCEDDDGNIYHMRSRALYAKKVSEEQSQKTQEKIEEYLQNLEKTNQNQLGLRKKLYQEYISNAVKRLIPFNLTFDNFNSLISQPCYYCGAEPELKTRFLNRANMKEPMLKANGVDRKDSSKFYDLDNCVPCCSICNIMKGTMTSEQFIEHINRISKYSNSKESSTTISKESTS